MVLTAFLVGLALVLAASVYAIVRAVGLWRTARRSGGAITSELEVFEERTARMERLFDEADRSSRNLQLALERLRVSQARLQVLRTAFARSQEHIRWLRAFVPGL
jgi:hypothetical protein